MKKAIFVLTMIIGLGSVMESKAQVVSPDQVVELKSAPVAPSRGGNPSIKGTKPNTDEVKKKEQTRGQYTCDLKLENWSDYCIDVYIDGYYKCTLGEKTYMYTVVDLGYSSVYALSCGGTMEWKKDGISCSDKFTYRFY
jgi:hypothetical protein